MRKFRHLPAARRLKPSKGFTLIEVLVSFAIFAFAMLGAAGLQVWSLKSSKYSSNMAIAASLMRDYGDIMRAFTARVGSTLATDASSPFLLGPLNSADIQALSSGSAADKCFSGTACTTAEFRDAAVRDWLKRLDRALPQVRVVVCVDSSTVDADNKYIWDCDNTGLLVAIKLRWYEADTSATTGDQATAAPATGERPPLTVVTTSGVIQDSLKNVD